MVQYNTTNFRIWSKLGLKGSFFGIAAMELGELFDNLKIITADLASLSGLDRFKASFPDKIINVGIAEQNMLGISAGLANEGDIVFATTYATFITMRSFEQIRHYLGYMKSNVKIVGSGAGLVMGMSGNTHYSIEDIAIMRVIPNLVILSPADATEAVKVAFVAAQYFGPVYIRLTGGLNSPVIYKDDYKFEIGKAIILKENGDISIFATGTMVYNSLKAAEILESKSIHCKVINIHTLKPLDIDTIDFCSSESRLLITVEEHSKIGGLGGAIAEHISLNAGNVPLLRMGIDDVFKHAGDYNYLLEQNSLLPDQIANKIEQKYLFLNRS
jgi:transketolase